jgi:hypothetical protein
MRTIEVNNVWTRLYYRAMEPLKVTPLDTELPVIKMCFLRTQHFRTCGHETHRPERCPSFPDCFTRIMPPDMMDGPCPDCVENPLRRMGNIPVPPYMMPPEPPLRDFINAIEQWGSSPAPWNIPVRQRIPPPPLAPRDHQQPRFPAPEQAPNVLAPDLSDPYVTALRMHRARMTELEDSFQTFLANMHNQDHGDVPHGPGSALHNMRELLSSAHAPIADMNREYVDRLGGLIDLLDSLEAAEEGFRSPRPPPAPRPAPARPVPAARPRALDFLDDPDDDNVPDMPNFPDAWLDEMLNEEANLERAIEATAAEFAPDLFPRSENAQRGVSHGFMTRISPGSLGPDDRQCPICMQEIGSDDEHPVRLDCGHVFGHRCIERWFNDNTTCPVCRRDYDGQI